MERHWPTTAKIAEAPAGSGLNKAALADEIGVYVWNLGLPGAKEGRQSLCF